MATAPDRAPLTGAFAHSLSPVHPGEILSEEFLAPLGLSQSRAAHGLHVSPQRVRAIVQGKRSVTADTALRLAAFLGTTPAFWMNLQAHYDLEVTRDASGERIAREVAAYEAGAYEAGAYEAGA